MVEITEKQVAKEFGQFLKEARLQKGWYQDMVAAQAGLTQAYYCNVEQGKRMPTLLTSLKLCDVLGVNYNEFLKPYIEMNNP